MKKIILTIAFTICSFLSYTQENIDTLQAQIENISINLDEAGDDLKNYHIQYTIGSVICVVGSVLSFTGLRSSKNSTQQLGIIGIVLSGAGIITMITSSMHIKSAGKKMKRKRDRER